MAKALKIIGTIAGAVALVATGVGAFAVAGSALAASAASVAGIATLASGIAQVGATLLSRPPPARGSVAQVLIAPDAPQPYVMGEGYFGGVLRHDTAWGATLNKVPNPYRFWAVVYSGGGPVQSLTPYVDQTAVGSYYNTFLYTTTHLGVHGASAITPQWASAPGTGVNFKFSGQAAIGWSFKFDKDGKVFASGLPQIGAYGQWVKVYDPRLDGTRPGGVGAHRVDDETTWAWSANPALHAAVYAYGRYQNDLRTMGIGLPDSAIDWANIAAWASVCEDNGWTLFGAVYEPGDRWRNLVDIAAAGGAEPVLSADLLRFHYAAPRVALDTVTVADLAGEKLSVTAMAAWRERINTIVPRYISADHDWEQVQAEAVSVGSYVTEDGEIKTAEWPFNLVKDKDQAAQLAAYRLVDARELQPIEIELHPRFRAYRPGDCLAIDLPELGLDTDAVILRRRFDPQRMVVGLTLLGETAAKHAYALGLTGVAPPTPAIGLDGEDRDALAAAAGEPGGWAATQIRSAAIKDPRTAGDVPRALLESTWDTGAGSATVTVAKHDWDYPGLEADTIRDLHTITGFAADYPVFIYFDDETLIDTTPAFGFTQVAADAQNSTVNPHRHALGHIVTANAGSGAIEGGEAVGYGLSMSFFY